MSCRRIFRERATLGERGGGLVVGADVERRRPATRCGGEEAGRRGTGVSPAERDVAEPDSGTEHRPGAAREQRAGAVSRAGRRARWHRRSDRRSGGREPAQNRRTHRPAGARAGLRARLDDGPARRDDSANAGARTDHSAAAAAAAATAATTAAGEGWTGAADRWAIARADAD